MPRKTSKRNSESSDNKIWLPPRVPWELELFTLLLVVAAFALPLFLFSDLPKPEGAQPPQSFAPNMVNILWVFAILGTYLAHVATMSTQVDYCTSPPINLFAPLLFGLLCYGNLFYIAKDRGVSLPLVSGEWHQLVGYPILILGICLFMARVRTLRHRLRFRHVVWKLSSPPQVDSSFFFDLGRAILPVCYLPRRYLFSEEGILVEGFHYLYAIPFQSIESIEHSTQFSSLTKATYYAGSTGQMIQIQLNDHTTPIMISPKNIQDTLTFCEQHAMEHIHIPTSRARSAKSPEKGKSSQDEVDTEEP